MQVNIWKTIYLNYGERLKTWMIFLHNFSSCEKNIQAWTGFEPKASATLVQCSYNWPIKPTGSWSHCVFRIAQLREVQKINQKTLHDIAIDREKNVVYGAVASWLVGSSSPDRAVRVWALARDIVLCSWARHLTLTVPLSTQVYNWVPAKLMLGVTLRWTSIPSRGE